jgi:hypothetical protein
MTLGIPGTALPVSVAETFSATPVSLPAKYEILERARLGTAPTPAPMPGSDIAQVMDTVLHLRRLWAAPRTNTAVEAVRTGIARRRLVVYPTVQDASGEFVPYTRRARTSAQVTRDYETVSGVGTYRGLILPPFAICKLYVGYADRGAGGTPTLTDLTVEVVVGTSTVSQATVLSHSVVYVKVVPGDDEVGAVLRVRAVDDLHFTDPASGNVWALDAAKPRLDHEFYLEF